DRLVSYLTRMTGCRESAEDVAQDTFLRFHAAVPRYRDEGHLPAYLFRIATNLVRQEERRRKRWRLLLPRLTAASNGRNGHRAAFAAEDRLLAREMSDRLTAAVAALPLAHRVPIVLRDVEGHSYAEITRITGWREGTVKSRLNRARSKLRSQLRPYLDGDRSHDA
ncbi:MAG: RNA polymerase sigma factor, partial [Acidobacteriota bacterium]